jgi:hypothetical protein
MSWEVKITTPCNKIIIMPYNLKNTQEAQDYDFPQTIQAHLSNRPEQPLPLS